MQSRRKNLPKIQCLDTGQIYLNHLELDKEFNGDSRYALKNHGKFRGKFYVELDAEHPTGYTSQECTELLNNYNLALKQKLNASYQNGGQTTKANNYKKYQEKFSTINTVSLTNDYIQLGLGKITICNKYGITMHQLELFLKENNLKRATYKRPDTSRRNRDEANKKRNIN